MTANYYSRYSVVRARSAGRLAARMVFTLAGAAAMVAGALLPFSGEQAGTELAARAFYQASFERSGRFVTSVGFAFVALGLLALVGLVNSTGWLTRFAGVLGVAAFVLVAVQVYRSPANDLGPGAWLALAGAVAAIVGGYFGRFFPVITRIVPPGS